MPNPSDPIKGAPVAKFERSWRAAILGAAISMALTSAALSLGPSVSGASASLPGVLN
jgi:hypothetical protein